MLAFFAQEAERQMAAMVEIPAKRWEILAKKIRVFQQLTHQLGKPESNASLGMILHKRWAYPANRNGHARKSVHTLTRRSRRVYVYANTGTYTVSGQNKIGRELTLLALIQPTVIKQNVVNNHWL